MIGVQFALPADGLPPDIAGRAVRRPRLFTPPAAPERAAILAAPVFAPDRRPGAATELLSDTAVAGNLGGYAALGSVAGRGVATAVIRAPTGEIKTLRRGDRLEGWRLAAVDGERLEFEQGRERRMLRIGAPPAAPALSADPR